MGGVEMTLGIKDTMVDEFRQAAAIAKGAKCEVPELDMDVMRRLYEFGGLMVYRLCILTRCCSKSRKVALHSTKTRRRMNLKG